MIRSEHVLMAAFGLLIVVAVCLGMLGLRCPDCGLHVLSWIAVSAMSVALSLGGILLVVTIWSTQRLWRIWQRCTIPHPPTLQRVCQQLGLPAHRVICINRPDVIVCCLGLLHPKIVVSTGLLEQVSPRELAAILVHERHHQQRRDPLQLLAMKIMRLMLYPLPAIHDFYRSYLALQEIEADKAAITISGRPALAGALHKLLSLPAPGARRPLDAERFGPLSPAITHFSANHSRLEYLLNPYHTVVQLPFSVSRLLVSLLPFLALCLSMFAA